MREIFYGNTVPYFHRKRQQKSAQERHFLIADIYGFGGCWIFVWTTAVICPCGAF